jgi:CBS domain-containing protein
VSTTDKLDRAAQLMVEYGVDHLIVADAHDGHPVGMLSTLDVAGVLAWGEG